MTGFRPFFNPATGEWIEYTALAEDSNGVLVRFNWRSVPGGVITEHIHPHQEERFTIKEGEAHFTLNGRELVARTGETIVVPAGDPSLRGKCRIDGYRGPGRVAAGPAHQGVPRGVGRACQRRQDHAKGSTKEPAPAWGHLLAFPTREPGDLATHLGSEYLSPSFGCPGEGLRSPPLLRALGQPDLLIHRQAT